MKSAGVNNEEAVEFIEDIRELVKKEAGFKPKKSHVINLALSNLAEECGFEFEQDVVDYLSLINLVKTSEVSFGETRQ